MKTRIQQEEDQAMVMQIPGHIQKDIEDKGFHLYMWISPDEVKLSIERDFLRTLSKIGLPLAVISVLAGFITGFNLLVFFLTISIGVFFIFLYLFFLSFKRSFLLSKSAFVVMTDSSISLGGKIHKLSDISGLKKDIDQVSETFEEDLFGESRLSGSKNSLMKQVLWQLFGGYQKILTSKRYNFSKDNEGAIIMFIALYTLYLAVMISVYFVGVLFLGTLGNLISWMNTQYLLKKGHSVTKINSFFGKIDRSSKDIYEEKYNLENLLTQAYNNNWKDGLLLEINRGIANINKNSQKAVLEVLELRNTIERSKYKDMFSFEVYNAWIKKQLGRPLQQILELLEKNGEILDTTHKEIETQIHNIHITEYKGTLQLQLQRIELQKREIEKYVPIIEESLEKLK